MFCEKRQIERPLVLAALVGCLCMSANDTAAAPSTSAFAWEKKTLWESYTPSSHHLVSSLDAIGGRLFEKGHHAFGLDRKGPMARIAYMLTGGLALTSFVRANSIYFGHEGAHFQFADADGKSHHVFTDHDTGAAMSWGHAYLNAFKHGVVGGTARSWSEDDLDPSQSLSREDRIRSMWSNNAGVNWQMAHSERVMRRDLLRGEGRASDAVGQLYNRGYMSFYALRDVGKDDTDSGDFVEYGGWLEEAAGVDDPVEKIAIISLLSMIASPGILDYSRYLNGYVETGDLAYEPFGIDIGPGRKISWDIPNYAAPMSYTIAPTLYMRDEGSMAANIGADAVLLGAGHEFSVMGESAQESVIHLGADYGRTVVSLELAGGGDGLYASIGMNHHLGHSIGLQMDFMHAEGETMHGMRNLPQGGDLVWLGFVVDFGRGSRGR